MYDFPIALKFKIGTIHNDFVATDANDYTIAYVRQKLLKFIEEIEVFEDDDRSNLKYRIKANKWIDFSASYVFTDAQGTEIGRVARKGWASLWKARYEIYDENRQQDLIIKEDNGWVKVLDAIFGQIPGISLLTGYLFNPSYTVSRPDGTEVVQLRKVPSFWGRKFELDKLSEFEQGEENRVVLGCMMMILLERRRG